MTKAMPSTPAAGAGDFLEFEKPLLRIAQDIEALHREQATSGRDNAAEIAEQASRFQATMRKLYASLTPWETVLVARHPKRPLSPDYLRMIFKDFCELHGDRLFADDRAMITGFARLPSTLPGNKSGHKVMFIGHNKGKDIKERVACNFGCAHPEGYRKALAKMKLAEKFGLPVVCLIDTQGAYPGVGSEERGISSAIAVNLLEMSRLRTPVVCVVIGEGGSGGALGIGVGDRVAMFENSFYSVISPEGCAAILWKTAERRQHAAEALNLTAKSLKRLSIIDEIIDEPIGGAHRHPDQAAANLARFLDVTLTELKARQVDELVSARYQRVRHMGSFFEEPTPVQSALADKILAESSKPKGRRVAPRSTRLRSRFSAGSGAVTG